VAINPEKQDRFHRIFNERLMLELPAVKPVYFADAVHPGIPDPSLRLAGEGRDQIQRFFSDGRARSW